MFYRRINRENRVARNSQTLSYPHLLFAPSRIRLESARRSSPNPERRPDVYNILSCPGGRLLLFTAFSLQQRALRAHVFGLQPIPDRGGVGAGRAERPRHVQAIRSRPLLRGQRGQLRHDRPVIVSEHALGREGVGRPRETGEDYTRPGRHKGGRVARVLHPLMIDPLCFFNTKNLYKT